MFTKVETYLRLDIYFHFCLQVPVPTKFCASQQGSQRYH